MNESLIMRTAIEFQTQVIEEKFNVLVENGIKDIIQMEVDVLQRCDSIEIELLSNFKDFVFLCIDVKKKSIHDLELVSQQQQQPQQQQTAPTQQQDKNIQPEPTPVKKNRK